MDEQELRTLLQASRRHTAQRWRCPDENEVIKYINAQLPSARKDRFEAHLAQCEPCRDLVGFLFSSNDWRQAEPVPPHLLVRARKLSEPRRPFWSIRWPVTAPAAVALLVLVFLGFRLYKEQAPGQQTEPLVAQVKQQQAPVRAESVNRSVPALAKPAKPALKESSVSEPRVRGRTNAIKPSILFPRERGVVNQAQLDFRWSQSEDTVFYELRIVDQDGNTVFTKTNLNETRLHVPNVGLAPGQKYFASVYAHRRDGRIQKSDLVAFSVSP